MVVIKLYAYKLVPSIEGREVCHLDWKAIDIIQNTAILLARMYKGKADCTSCGTVQYDDRVTLDDLSKEDEQFLKATFPFISISRS